MGFDVNFMRRFTSTEIGGLILGMLLLLGGLDSVIWPQAGAVPHFTNDVLGLSPGTKMEVVSTAGARVYGLLAIMFGAGIVTIAMYRGK